MWPVFQHWHSTDFRFLKTSGQLQRSLILWFRFGFSPAAIPSACLQPLAIGVPPPPDLTHVVKPVATGMI